MLFRSGSGLLVFGTSPTLTTPTVDAGTFSGLSTFARSTTSLLSVTSTAYFGSTATSTFDSAGTLTLNTAGTGQLDLGNAGVRLTDDGDGALTILSLGDGNTENLILNLDDTADTGTFTSGTGLATLCIASGMGAATIIERL